MPASIKAPVSRAQVRNDGWTNSTTGLGDRDRDKAMHSHFERDHTLSFNYGLLSALYHDDDISGRIVDIVPDHMFRRGWETKIKDDKDRSVAAEFAKDSRRLLLTNRLRNGMVWGRLYGGCIGVLGIKDGRTPSEPVDEANIQEITHINLVDRRFVYVDSYYTSFDEGMLGEPKMYRVSAQVIDPKNPGSSNINVLIHESRVLRFEGANTDNLERQLLGGWTHSSLQRPYEKIKAFVQAFQASGNLMTDASQGVYKLEGLMSQIAGGEKGMLEARMMMMDMGRSVARSIILDKDGEEFERTMATISGYPEMLDRFMMLLSAATDIPVTLLMGRSAAGSNSTGDGDFRAFYSAIANRQTHDLEPILQRVYRLMSLAKKGPTKGKESEFEFKFRPLWQPTSLEQSQINFTQAQADSLYVTMGAVSAEEVAISRFGDDGDMALTTTIDVQARRDAQEALESFDPHENDPEPTAEELAAASGGLGKSKVPGGAVGTKVINQAPKQTASPAAKASNKPKA